MMRPVRVSTRGARLLALTVAVAVGSSVLGLPARPAAAADNFRVFFQANDNVLAEYSSGQTTFSSTLGMAPGTSPSAARLSDGTYEVTFQANNHYLAFNHFGGGTMTTHYGMDAASSPAVAGLPNGGWVSVFQANTHHLYVYTSAGVLKDTGLGMYAGTTPAIAALPNGAWAVAFEANTGDLATYSSNGSSSDTHAGLLAGTSPVIAGLHDGSYELAGQANTNRLVTAHVSGSGQSTNATTLGMAVGTDPSIAVQSNGTDWAVAFQANNGDLATYNNHGSSSDTHAGLLAGTSPSILAFPDGSYELAGQTNTNHLVTAHVSGSGQSVNATTLGMDAGTSPSFGPPTAAAPPVTHPASTNVDWAKVVLDEGNWPVCGNNVTVLTQWMDSEEPASDWWNRNNPLNNGDGSGGGAGLGSYDNLVTAAYYVAHNINANPSWYGQIDSDLAACASTGTTAQAIWNSPWASSHYGNGSTWHSGSVPTVAAPASAWGSSPPPVPAAAAVTAAVARADAAAFGQLPVMGYNTWYQFGGGLTENAVLTQAQHLVSSGLAAAGYDTMNLDDGWTAAARTSDGSLTWNTTKFPDGLPFLADQLHSMGLKFGIYEAIGTRTCQGLPGSGGTTAATNHYAQDARTFADWGVDFVKIDECGGLPSGTTLSTLTTAFQQYGNDLRAADPAVVYSEELPIYELGKSDFVQSVQSSSTFANMWRVAADESTANPASTTILGHLAADLHLHAFAGPGHWNDLDMVVPGKPAAHPFGWTLAEQQSQLSVWAEEASPLLVSTDLTTLTAAELAALKNPDIIAIDQSGSQPATAITSASGNVEAVFKKADGGTAVLFANLGTGTATATFTLAQLGITATEATGHNIWNGKTSTFSGVNLTLGAGQTETLVIKPLA
jgi:alpha-galactosidase